MSKACIPNSVLAAIVVVLCCASPRSRAAAPKPPAPPKPTVEKLWPDDAPGIKDARQKDKPTLTICLLIWIMVKQNMFAKELTEQILKVRLPADIPYDGIFDGIFAKYLARVDLLSVETVQAGTLTELVYGVEFRKQTDAQALITDVRKLNQNNKVVLITGKQDVDL